MLSQNIARGVAFFEKYLPDIVKPITNDAVVTLYVTASEIDEKTLKLLKVFVMTHCNMNKNATVYIFLCSHYDIWCDRGDERERKQRRGEIEKSI